MAEQQSLNKSDGEQSKFEQGSDFANYFCTYAFLYHQKQMLEDKRRMDAYFTAIMHNKHHFEDKVVLDVGAGSGILSIWAAKAGARKVYAVEATQAAKYATILAEAEGLADRVEVVRTTVEDLKLPEKVDVIVSEWMGYFLLRESMLDSVLVARDRWLKPDGLLYPNVATMSIAPLFNDDGNAAQAQYQNSVAEWSKFVGTTRDRYGVDMNCLTKCFRTEHTDHYLGTATWQDMDGSDHIAPAAEIKSIDLNTCTLEDFKEFTVPYSCTVRADTYFSGWCGWFAVRFEGRASNPAKEVVELDTAPGKGYTHWGQQMFPFYPALYVKAGQEIEGTLELTRQKENQRLLAVGITQSVKDKEKASEPVLKKWLIN